MKTICLYFQVHQPMQLQQFSFIDIGTNDYYYDDDTNHTNLKKIAKDCYLPANKIISDLIKRHKGQFKVAYSISGITLDLLHRYTPEVIQSFKELAETGCVEFVAETYFHSLTSLKDETEFKKQVNLHVNKIEQTFGQRPKVFRNTEFIYSDNIGVMVSDMGFNTILAKDSQGDLNGSSPGQVYTNTDNPKLNILLGNAHLNDDITFHFSDEPWTSGLLSTKKYMSWLNENSKNEKLVNLFMNYETFGVLHKKETGIFKLLKALPTKILKSSHYKFLTPSEVVNNLKPVSTISANHPVYYGDEKSNLNTFLGNEMQTEAFTKCNDLAERINTCNDEKLIYNWRYLQSSDHFYNMCITNFTDTDLHLCNNPYRTPFDAFINYMNILNDLTIRVNRKLSPKQKMIQKQGLKNRLYKPHKTHSIFN